MNSKEMLAKVPVYIEQDIPCIKFSEIPEPYRKEFDEWMRGQTYPIIKESHDYVYEWDWVRWCGLKFDGNPTYFD